MPLWSIRTTMELALSWMPLIFSHQQSHQAWRIITAWGSPVPERRFRQRKAAYSNRMGDKFDRTLFSDIIGFHRHLLTVTKNEYLSALRHPARPRVPLPSRTSSLRQSRHGAAPASFFHLYGSRSDKGRTPSVISRDVIHITVGMLL